MLDCALVSTRRLQISSALFPSAAILTASLTLCFCVTEILWLSATKTLLSNFSCARWERVEHVSDRRLDMGMCTNASWVLRISVQSSSTSNGLGWDVETLTLPSRSF